MANADIDDIRAGVLDRIEADNRRVRLLILVAALTESLIIGAAIVLANWRDPLHRLVMVVGVGTWTLLAIGFVVLGSHVSRVGSRTLAALTTND